MRSALLAKVACVALVALLGSSLHAIERKPLPEFALSALDGTETSSADLVAEGQWLLVYVQMGCPSCDTLMQTLVDQHSELARRTVIVIGGVNAATATKLAGAFPALSAARWYADRSNALAETLRAAGVPVVYGLRGKMLEWSLTGIVPDAATYRTTLVSWVTAQ
jgi:hypothetical protein